MLQIIGLLGCAMLAVKVLEMTANPALRLPDGNLKSSALLAVGFGWISVLGFSFWLSAQAGMFERPQSEATYSPSYENRSDPAAGREDLLGPVENPADVGDEIDDVVKQAADCAEAAADGTSLPGCG